MTPVGVAVGAAAAGGDRGGEGVRPHAEGRMDLCIPAIDPPMMMARVAFGLCVGPQVPHVMLV
jgi:hypothetical protein